MAIPNKNLIEALRKEYLKGTRIELIKMDDQFAPPIGTQGTVIGVDDIGSLLVKWDNGSGLNVIYGEDIVRKVNDMPSYYSEPSQNRLPISPTSGTIGS